MTWCNFDPKNITNNQTALQTSSSSSSKDESTGVIDAKFNKFRTIACPSCGHHLPLQDQAGLHDLPGLPAGVRFDPTDTEILEHLEAKVVNDSCKLHPLIDEFIPTLEGENGICCTHPEKLPGVSKDGLIRHFFHRPSKAYTTGTRKRRKVHTDDEGSGSETRWHKTGKTRPVFVNGVVKGFKKILVLYTNYGRQKKPEKTNWVMHQYHLGDNEEEKEGELVVSKVFYQTQPRQCSSSVKEPFQVQQLKSGGSPLVKSTTPLLDYYHHPTFIHYDVREQNRESPPQLIPNLVAQGEGSPLVHLTAANANNIQNKNS
ncbi:hypothetical protein Ancab_033885 [Ancistrocladus abbreviatus]